MVVLVAVLLVSGSIDKDPAFLEARELYRELEFERATIRFQEAALSPGRTPEDRARLFAWIAICYAQLNDLKGARRALVDAVKQDSDLLLPSDAPPMLREMLSEVRAALPPPETQKKPADVAPPDTVRPEEPEEKGVPADPALNLGGIATASAGGAALVTGGLLGVLALMNISVALDPATTQVDLVRARDTANAELWVAGISAGVGVALTTGGIAWMLAE